MQTEATSQLAEATTAGADALPHLSQGQMVERILRGESATPQAPQEGTPDPAEQQPPVAREPLSLKAVAEKFGVDPADLYRELKVSLGDGQEVTLEDAKARLKDVAKLDEDRQALIKQRGTLEADRLAQLRELAALQAGDQPTYQRELADRMSREREAMLRSIPEWADPAVITAERKQLQDYLAENGGWPPEAIDLVENHRLFVTLRGAMKDRAELKALRAEKAKADQPKPQVGMAPRKGSDQTAGQKIGVLKAAVTKGQLSQTAAVDRLLQGR